jgi:lipopolysaccharide export LptBFGC system permease protein LptF
MSEFIAVALDNELHPKYEQKEGNNMANTRTVAFQVPEDLFQRIKDYLNRNHMTQKQFLLGLIEQELDREQAARKSLRADSEDKIDEDDDEPELDGDDEDDDFEDDFDEDEDIDEDTEYDEEPDDDAEEDEDSEYEEDPEDEESEDEDLSMSM